MHIFFAPTFPEESSLSEEESKHAFRVLRLKVGDTIEVINGRGSFYTCEITSLDKRTCELSILSEKKENPRSFYLHIAIAPTKNIDRIEWFVEKCVEFGVDEITFLKSSNSERKVIKLERIKRIATSAMKQSQHAYFPKINELVNYKEFLGAVEQEHKLIAHLVDDNRQGLKSLPLNSTYCMLIGPEGDFTPGEVQLALAKDFKPVTLGSYRLRTETAGIAVCHALNFMHE
jgi:16S rRNA (uracil1498-N3)-methyltransferase